MRKAFLTASFAVVAFLCVGIATAAGPSSVVRSGNLEVTFGEGFAPKALSKTVPTPIALRLWSRIESIDGSPPPAMSEFTFDTDKNSAIDVRGLPTCPILQYRSRSAHPGLDCGDAIVGAGTVSLDIHFPEQAPIPVESKMTIFNGGVEAGVTTLRAFSLPHGANSHRAGDDDPNRKDPRRSVREPNDRHVPKIANGAGSLTSFSAKIGRSFARNGKRVSLLTANAREAGSTPARRRTSSMGPASSPRLYVVAFRATDRPLDSGPFHSLRPTSA